MAEDDRECGSLGVDVGVIPFGPAANEVGTSEGGDAFNLANR